MIPSRRASDADFPISHQEGKCCKREKAQHDTEPQSIEISGDSERCHYQEYASENLDRPH